MANVTLITRSYFSPGIKELDIDASLISIPTESQPVPTIGVTSEDAEHVLITKVVISVFISLVIILSIVMVIVCVVCVLQRRQHHQHNVRESPGIMSGGVRFVTLKENTQDTTHAGATGHI